MDNSIPSLKTIERRMSIAQSVITVIGAAIPFIYLGVIDPGPTGQEPVRTLEWPSVVFFVFVLAVTFVGGSAWGRKRSVRIATWYGRLMDGTSADQVPANVRRDVLNVATHATIISAGMWAFATVFSGLMSASYRTFIGVGIGGLLSTTMLYFAMDLLWRPCIPLFFPEGGLRSVGAFRLPALGRLLVVFGLVGILLPALLASLTWQRARTLVVAPDPQVVLRNLFALQVFVLGSSVVASIVLAILVTRGITDPLDALQTAMVRVEEHDLDVRAPVTTTDELGYLAERFNEMLIGLRERERIVAANQRIAQELAIAWKIQESFLPRDLPHIPGWQLTATMEPAKQTSGDFYDVIPLPDGRIGIVVADVADKGTGAALYMALSRTLIRTYALEYATQPERALSAANHRILMDAQVDLFVTVFYGVLDPSSGRLTYCNAGHNPPYLVHRQAAASVEDAPQALRRTGMPLGIYEDAAWEQRCASLGPGDVLMLYSDGITDAHNPSYESFGEERLLGVARARPGGSALDIQNALLSEVDAFREDAPQFDDMTLLVVVRELAAN